MKFTDNNIEWDKNYFKDTFDNEKTFLTSFIFTNKGTEPFNHNIDSSQLIEKPELLLNKIHNSRCCVY